LPLILDIPTLIEQGTNLRTGDAWTQLWAPHHTPKTEVKLIQQTARKALDNADLKDQFTNKLAVTADFKTADQMAKSQADELKL
jgi:tripartite-type tricarboxylate transporter receptor subunit TctC